MPMNPFANFFHPSTTPEKFFSAGFSIVCGFCFWLFLVCAFVCVEKFYEWREKREEVRKKARLLEMLLAETE